MNSKNILRGVILGLGILLVILAIGIASSRVASKNKLAENTPTPNIITDQKPEENLKVVYIVNKGGGQDALKMDYALSKDKKQTVFDVLKDLSNAKGFGLEYNYNYPKLGVLIDSIAGIKSGTDGKYWQYYVNDVLGDVAADKKELKAGDKVEWKFEKTNF